MIYNQRILDFGFWISESVDYQIFSISFLGKQFHRVIYRFCLCHIQLLWVEHFFKCLIRKKYMTHDTFY
jgi:hypothetical protein